jgi:hypothetical protein
MEEDGEMIDHSDKKQQKRQKDQMRPAFDASTAHTPSTPGNHEQPWPNEEKTQNGRDNQMRPAFDASTAHTPEMPAWIASLPPEQRQYIEEQQQYLRAAQQIALEERELRQQISNEDQHLRKEFDQAKRIITKLLPHRQAHYTLAQQATQFEKRYQSSITDFLNGDAKTVPISVYQKLLQRFNLLRNGTWKPAERLIIDEIQYQLDNPQKTDHEGYIRINYENAARHIGMSESTPKRTLQNIIEQCPDFPLECKWNVPDYAQDGRKIEALYAKPTVSNLRTVAPTLTLEAKKKQGGNQYQCQNPACLSTNIRIDHRLVCLDCGHISNLPSTYPNGRKPSEDKSKEHPNAFSEDAQKNVSPENQPVTLVITSDPPSDSLRVEPGSSEANEVTAAAQLLLEIAGPDPAPIEMSRAGEKKYYSIKPRRPLKLADLVDHLRGGRARGALCVHGNLTRALCFDADTAPAWQRLRDAALQLAQAGYVPLLEESPAGRGGHLWIIFDALVNAAAARAAVLAIAPELAEVVEYWPGPTGNRVRLPGGKYVRLAETERKVSAWCKLVNVQTGEQGQDGLSSARLLLASLSSAAIVPPISPELVEEKREGEACAPVTKPPVEPVREQPVAPAPGSRPLPKVDAAWIGAYGPVETATFWFAVTEDRAAIWFNEHHPLESIRPCERNGMALSPNGDERTASTSYHQTAQGERYTDHSQHGKRPDGTKDSGDALELACKVWGESKAVLLKRAAGEIVAQARAAMTAAARADQLPPAWVCELMTPAGWREYDKLMGKCISVKTEEGKHERRRDRLDTGSRGGTGISKGVERGSGAASGESGSTGRSQSFSGGGKLASAGSDVRNGAGQLCGEAERGDKAAQGHNNDSTEAAESAEGVVVAPVPARPLDRADEIKAWAKTHGWPAFEVNGKLLIAAGQSNWLHILLMAGYRDVQDRVYAEIQRRASEAAAPAPTAPPVHPALNNPIVAFAADLFQARVEVVAPDQGH